MASIDYTLFILQSKLLLSKDTVYVLSRIFEFKQKMSEKHLSLEESKCDYKEMNSKLQAAPDTMTAI